MMRRLVLMAGAGLLALAPAQATAQRGWQAATCDLNTGHYLVNSAVLYLRNASTTRFPDQRQRDLRDADRVLNQALDQGRDDDPAVWYYLGRFYVMRTDLTGADTAFDRAQTLAPQCAGDIRTFRRQLWVPTLNRGVDALQNGDNASAKDALREAIAIYDQEPPPFYYLAQIFATQGRDSATAYLCNGTWRDAPAGTTPGDLRCEGGVTPESIARYAPIDSAVAYYRQTIRIARDSLNRDQEQSVNILKNSTFNTARLFHRQQQYDSAAAWYRRYREIDPDDPQALTGLAEMLAAARRDAEAQALYDTVLARAGELPALDVFATGVALFRGNRFPRAARAFELGLEKSPNYRDALFNLANTYLSMANDSGVTQARKTELGTMMQPVIERLLTVDPANRASMRLLAASYQLRNMQDSTLAVLQRANDLPFDVTVSMFQPVGGGTWEVRGLLTNAGETPREIPALTFEFLTEAGEVVATQELPAQTVEAAVPFGFRVQGETIAAWRYRIGG